MTEMGTQRKRRFKLVHVTTVPQSLGFVRGQVGYMRRRGFEVAAISSPGELLSTFGRDEQVQTYAVPMLRRISPVHDIRALVRLIRLFRKVKPTLIHGHTPKGGLLSMLAGWMSGIPVRVYTVHGLWYLSGKGWRREIIRLTERVSCYLAHKVLCVSPSLADRVIADGICPAEKIVVVGSGSPNGIDAEGKFNPDLVSVERKAAVRNSLGIPDDALVIGFVGRIFRVKGVAELEAAWQSIRCDYPHTHLMIVGTPDPQNPIPEEANARLRQDNRVHFAGQVRDTPSYYAAMDLLVLPSYQEGFGVVLLEAAAMGLATVSTRVIGCVDAVQDGVTGTLVPAREVESLDHAIRTYIDDADLRRRHGQAGRLRALREYRQGAMWDGIHRQYMDLLRERGGIEPTPFPDDEDAK